MKRVSSNNGIALVTVIIYAVLVSLALGAVLSQSVHETKSVEREELGVAAYYLADAGVQKALHEIITRDDSDTLPVAEEITTTSLNDEGTGTSYYGEEPIRIEITPQSAAEFDVESTATINLGSGNSVSRTIYATINHAVRSDNFDYVYFINNWGWFYGNSILAKGDVRSNGNFSFKYNPTVNGEAYAADEIQGGENIKGTGGKEEDGEYVNQFAESDVLPMPNLSDLSVYEEKAQDLNASISVGGVLIVDGIYGDDSDESGNLVLIGTNQDPIEISGPNVIRGDVVIKGVIKGQGTIYAGRNIYVADSLTYDNSPGYGNTNPDKNDNAVDTWYDNNKDKDLVCFAANENIFWGDYTSTSWKSNCYDNYLSGWGEEDSGDDSIPGTGDEHEDDGIWQEDSEDIDGDGVQDDNYSWYTDIVTSVPIDQFDNVPEDVTSFCDIATNDVMRLDGIFYTNHAISGRCKNLNLYGAVIAKDEAIIFNNSFNIFYDMRVHSRFATANAEWFLQLGLPVVDKWEISEWHE